MDKKKNNKFKSRKHIFCIFSAVIILVSIIGTSFVSFADGDIDFISYFNVTDTCVTTDDFQSSVLLSPDSSLVTAYKNFVLANNSSVPSNQISNNINYNQAFTDYVAIVRNDGVIVGFYIVPAGSYCVVSTNSVDIIYSERPDHTQANNNNVMPVYFYTNGGYWSQDLVQTHDVVIDGVSTAVYSIIGTQKFVASSVECFGIDSSFADWDKSTSSLGNNINSNYAGGVGNVSKEDYDEYAYIMDGSDIFYAGSDCNTGVWTLQINPNNKQMTDAVELAKWKVRVNYDVYYNITVNSIVNDWDIRNILRSYGDFSGTSFTANVHGTGYRDVNFGELSINNGKGTSQWTMSSINDTVKCSGSTIYPLANFCASSRTSVWQTGLSIKGDEIFNGISVGAFGGSVGLPEMKTVSDLVKGKYAINNITYATTITLMNVDNGKSYGSKQSNFCLASNVGAVGKTDGANNLTVSQNDVNNTGEYGQEYYDHSGSGETSVDVNSGNSSASSGGSNANNNISEGAIVNNNNPTITINNGSGGLSQNDASIGTGTTGLIGTIVTMIATNKKSTADDLEGLTGMNGWVALLANTYSCVPQNIWTSLIITFEALVGIAVVGCIIKLALKIFIE